MMPTFSGTILFDVASQEQTSPELRRMDMLNRARRDEMDAMLHSLNPRHTVATGRTNVRGQQESAFGKMINGMRDGIGTALIAAGNRIQSAA